MSLQHFQSHISHLVSNPQAHPRIISITIAVLTSLLLLRRATKSNWISKSLGRIYPPGSIREVSVRAKKEPGVLYIHIPNLRPWGNPNASPFSVKLETFLRMAEIPFVIVRDFNLPKAPKKKIPWIEIHELHAKEEECTQGCVIMGDSELIIQYLQKRYEQKCKLTDDHLSDAEKGTALAFNRMLCEHTFACMGYARNYDLWDQTISIYQNPLHPLPFWSLKFISWRIRSNAISRLVQQGLGRHTRDEIYTIGCRDLKAISDFLGDKQFLMGDRPSVVDATGFGILTSLLWVPLKDFPMKEYADRELPNLQRYLLRIKDQYYTDTKEPWYIGGEYDARKIQIPQQRSKE